MELFVSYAIEDIDLFDIPNIINDLEKYPAIEKVYFWNRDNTSSQSIKEYMKEQIEKSDIFLIFCSELSMKSEAINFEITTAKNQKKSIIPIFKNINDVRKDLLEYRGVRYNKQDLKDFLLNFI